MFCECKSLSNIKALENWNVRSDASLSGMFLDCNLLSDLTLLEDWKNPKRKQGFNI